MFRSNQLLQLWLVLPLCVQRALQCVVWSIQTWNTAEVAAPETRKVKKA